ncbi:MAG: tetratricopeptide repeat protein, partial [Sphingobacteriales bacterium]
MKKTFAIISVSLITTLCAAQSVEQGNKDLDNERFAGAAKNFNAVIQQDPGNAAAWFGLVRATVLG